MRPSTARHFAEVKSLPEPQPDAPKHGKVQVVVLSSGSGGNCLIVSVGDSAIMVDCGITPKEASRRARSVGYTLAKLDAILITHWHKDHIGYLPDFAEFHCPVVCSRATLLGMETQPAKVRRAVPGEALEVGEFTVHPIKIDHEEGSLAYHIHVAGKNIVVAHDLGAPNSTVMAAARAADCLLIESNHDVGMLQSCTDQNHPAAMHEKILSLDRGHLSNVQAAEVVGCVDPAKIQAVCLLHLSSSHNTPEHAEGVARAALPAGANPQVYVAHQDRALLIEVNGGPKSIELPLIDQFRRLDRKVDAIIGEQKRADRESGERRVIMGEYLAEMRIIFESKEPQEKFEGFEFFDHWKAAKAKLYGVSERTMNYYLLDAETVVPIIGREIAISLPLGTISELGKMAKAKGHIPPATLQYAKEHSPAEVKAHVAAILYPGRTGHFDGPEEVLSVKAGVKQIAVIRKKLDVARSFVDEHASDADVIEYALEEFIQEHSKVVELQPIQPETTPVPPAPDFDFDLLQEEITDEPAASGT